MTCTGETVELEIKVEGMKCGGCSSRVEKALKVRAAGGRTRHENHIQNFSGRDCDTGICCEGLIDTQHNMQPTVYSSPMADGRRVPQVAVSATCTLMMIVRPC